MSTKDQMQDAFPVVFEYVKGEQSTAEKLTGLVKHVDTSFGRVTKAIGDPWDYQHHEDDVKLSLENLAQASIARIIGPSDYLSVTGGAFNETASSFTISLRADRNSWDIGYPLVKKLVDITPTSGIDDVTPLVWNTDIVVSTDTDGILTTIKTDPKEVVSDGDFYVDYYSGRIISYCQSTSTIVLSVSNMNMLSAGPPWATQNVIPSWEQTVGLCNITKVGTVGSLTEYTIDLPTVLASPRFSTSVIRGGVRDYFSSQAYASTFDYDTTFNSMSLPGGGSTYRVPIALTSAGLTAGYEIPEGYCNLWDDVLGRVVPSVTFYYRDENSFTVWTPEDWLEEGDGKYRIITSGASIAEVVNWLSNTVRDNRHTGLVWNGFAGVNNIRYTPPIDHWTLSGLHTGYIPDPGKSGSSDIWKFRTSSMPVNPHPQYLHRAGYDEDDLDGNTANAMRGDIVFSTVDDYEIVSGAPGTSTYGIMFGGGDHASNARVSFEGGEDLTSDRLYYGSYSGARSDWGAVAYTSPKNTGNPFHLIGKYAASGTTEYHYSGAVLSFDLSNNNETNYVKLMNACRPGTYDAYNMPVYKGQTETDTLAFTPYLDPSVTGSPISLTSATRLYSQQLREFRFRGIPYISTALNINDGIGAYESDTYSTGVNSYNIYSASGTGDYFIVSSAHPSYFVVGRTVTVSGAVVNNGNHVISAVAWYGSPTNSRVQINVTSDLSTGGAVGTLKMKQGDMDFYYTSPGVVGADFINLYSNVIFFSNTGDGKETSLTEHGINYFDLGYDTLTPTGLYFYPLGEDLASSPFYRFVHLNDAATESVDALEFGYAHGFTYSGTGEILLSTVSTEDSAITIKTVGILGVGGNINLESADDIDIEADDNINIVAEDQIYITSSSDAIDITATTTLYLQSMGDIQIQAGASGTEALLLQTLVGDINLTSADDIRLNATDDLIVSCSSLDIDAAGADLDFSGNFNLTAHEIQFNPTVLTINSLGIAPVSDYYYLVYEGGTGTVYCSRHTHPETL